MQLHIVFVHGASHGSWCWYKIMTLLEAAGYKVTCIDLKGAGINLTDSNTVLTFQDYNQPLHTFLSGLEPNEKVILVGHSAAGATVTDALCKFTHHISMTIYIAADMIRPGSTTQTSNELEGMPDIFDYTYGLGEDQLPTGILMKKQFQRQYYYNLSPVEDSNLALMLLRPAPVRALEGVPLPETPEVDTVPRVYMKTMLDQLFEQSRQDALIINWPPTQVYYLDTDHCPFFSNPSLLFACLIQAAQSIQPN